MPRLQKESGELMSLRLEQIARLKERIARDESRADEIVDLLMEQGALEKNRETDDLILEWTNLGVRIEQNKASLAKLKSPSERTDEERRYLATIGIKD